MHFLAQSSVSLCSWSLGERRSRHRDQLSVGASTWRATNPLSTLQAHDTLMTKYYCYWRRARFRNPPASETSLQTRENTEVLWPEWRLTGEGVSVLRQPILTCYCVTVTIMGFGGRRSALHASVVQVPKEILAPLCSPVLSCTKRSNGSIHLIGFFNIINKNGYRSISPVIRK